MKTQITLFSLIFALLYNVLCSQSLDPLIPSTDRNSIAQQRESIIIGGYRYGTYKLAIQDRLQVSIAGEPELTVNEIVDRSDNAYKPVTHTIFEIPNPEAPQGEWEPTFAEEMAVKYGIASRKFHGTLNTELVHFAW